MTNILARFEHAGWSITIYTDQASAGVALFAGIAFRVMLTPVSGGSMDRPTQAFANFGDARNYGEWYAETH